MGRVLARACPGRCTESSRKSGLRSIPKNRKGHPAKVTKGCECIGRFAHRAPKCGDVFDALRIELQNVRMSLTFSTPLPKKCECIARFLHRARTSGNVLDGSSTEFQKVWMYWAVCAWRRRRCEWIWRFAHRARKGWECKRKRIVRSWHTKFT